MDSLSRSKEESLEAIRSPDKHTIFRIPINVMENEQTSLLKRKREADGSKNNSMTKLFMEKNKKCVPIKKIIENDEVKIDNQGDGFYDYRLRENKTFNSRNFHLDRFVLGLKLNLLARSFQLNKQEFQVQKE